MAWRDNGNGDWEWDGSQALGYGNIPPKPSSPPPSSPDYRRGPSSAPPNVFGGAGNTGMGTGMTAPVVVQAPAPEAPAPMAPSESSGTDEDAEKIRAWIGWQQRNRKNQTGDLVDRYSAIQLDTGPADQARQAQQRALGMQEDIYNKLMAFDPEAEAAAQSKRATNSALVQARSSGGGAAARQAAQFQALQQTPAIQAEAAAQASQQAARNTQLAANAASEYAQTAQGTRGQDIQQAQAEVDTGLNVANGISNAIGRDMQLTSDEARFLGQMQIALEGLNVDWARLDEAQRAALVEEELRKKGLEQDWKMFKESQKVGVLDVVGAITGTARAGVGTYAQGKQAGLWG